MRALSEGEPDATRVGSPSAAEPHDRVAASGDSRAVSPSPNAKSGPAEEKARSGVDGRAGGTPAVTGRESLLDARSWPEKCPACRRKVVPIKAKFGRAFPPSACSCGQRLRDLVQDRDTGQWFDPYVDDFGDELDCTHCGGEGACDDGSDPLVTCPEEIHCCHACNGSGLRRDQTIW